MKSTPSPELAKVIRSIVEKENDDCRIYEQYSGRGMYGANCFGITIGRYSRVSVVNIVMQVVGDLRNGNPEECEDLLTEMLEMDWTMASDNLGLDMIYYFPNIQWPKEEETEDEDDAEDRK